MRSGFLADTARPITVQLHEAIRQRSERAIDLLDKNKDILEARVNGDTALLAATRFGTASIVELLLALNAHSNIIGNDGATPLHLAASRRDAGDRMVLLIAAAADRRGDFDAFLQRDAQGRLPNEVAVSLSAHSRIAMEALWRSFGKSEFTIQLSTFLLPWFLVCFLIILSKSSNTPLLPCILLFVLIAVYLGIARLDQNGVWPKSAALPIAALGHPRSKLGAGAALLIATLAIGLSLHMLYDLFSDHLEFKVLASSYAIITTLFLFFYARCALRSPPRISGRLHDYTDSSSSSSSCIPQGTASSHCMRCQLRISGRHHHCALLHRCVGLYNRISFSALLAFTVLCGVATFRVTVFWFAALRCGNADTETEAFSHLRRNALSFLKCAFLSDAGLTAAYVFLFIPLGCVGVAFALTAQILSIAGLDMDGLASSSQQHDDHSLATENSLSPSSSATRDTTASSSLRQRPPASAHMVRG